MRMFRHQLYLRTGTKSSGQRAKATFDVTPPSLESLSGGTCLLLNLCALGMSREDVASHMRELRYAKWAHDDRRYACEEAT